VFTEIEPFVVVATTTALPVPNVDVTWFCSAGDRPVDETAPFVLLAVILKLVAAMGIFRLMFPLFEVIV